MDKKILIFILGGIILITIIWLFFLTEKMDNGPTGSIILLESEKSQEIIEDNFFNVTYVVDGDTIEIETEERVRLVCIDTPERGEEGYKEAKEYVEDLILGKEVRLVKDVSEVGKYGRLVRYIYLEDETFVNELIVREGYGKVYWYEPDVTLCSIIQKAENYARENKLGIWKENEEDININLNIEQTINEQDVNYVCDCSSNIYNCDDFITHAEAQNCYEYCASVIGSDIHWLDGDDDGLACEDLHR